MNYGSIKANDVANGKGVRVSIFVSGCQHECFNCFNEEVWDFNYGEKYTKEVEEKVLNLLDKPYIKGLSLLGGEPIHPRNQEGLVSLVKEAKKRFPDKDIWCYTGFEFDRDIMKMYKFLPHTKDLIDNIDFLVDGKYMDEHNDMLLSFRGSKNQRIIDVKKSLKEKQVVLADEFLHDMRFEEMRLDNIYTGNMDEKQKVRYENAKEMQRLKALKTKKKKQEQKLKDNIKKVHEVIEEKVEVV